MLTLICRNLSAGRYIIITDKSLIRSPAKLAQAAQKTRSTASFQPRVSATIRPRPSSTLQPRPLSAVTMGSRDSPRRQTAPVQESHKLPPPTLVSVLMEYRKRREVLATMRNEWLEEAGGSPMLSDSAICRGGAEFIGECQVCLAFHYSIRLWSEDPVLRLAGCSYAEPSKS